jgi:pimeloyl-ACP methyl ester carboxylesterase
LRPSQHEIVLHGHRISYRTAGDSGPVVLLIHGIVGCAEQWDQVAPLLAERYTVVAPDLLGHGQSATPPACVTCSSRSGTGGPRW